MKWQNGTNHWHGYKEIPTTPYVKSSEEMEQFAGKKCYKNPNVKSLITRKGLNKSVFLTNLSSDILLK